MRIAAARETLQTAIYGLKCRISTGIAIFTGDAPKTEMAMSKSNDPLVLSKKVRHELADIYALAEQVGLVCVWSSISPYCFQ